MTSPTELPTPLLTLSTRDMCHAAVFSADGRRVITTAHETPPSLWDARTGKILAELRLPFIRSLFTRSQEDDPPRFTNVAISPDGRRALTTSNQCARLWDGVTGRYIATLEHDTYDDPHSNRRNLSAAVFSPIQRSVITRFDPLGTFAVSSTRTGRRRVTIRAHEKRLATVLFSPSGHHIVSASDESGIKLWHATAGRLAMTFGGHHDSATHLAFSPDGRYLLSTSGARQVLLWDTTTGKEHKSIECLFPIHRAAFSPDGSKIIAQPTETHPTYPLPILDSRSGETLAEIRGHEGHVWAVQFGPDGRHLVTASLDRTAIVWDAATAEARAVLRGHTGQITSAVWSPRGDRILTASDDSTARVWDVTPIVGRPRPRLVP